MERTQKSGSGKIPSRIFDSKNIFLHRIVVLMSCPKGNLGGRGAFAPPPPPPLSYAYEVIQRIYGGTFEDLGSSTLYEIKCSV